MRIAALILMFLLMPCVAALADVPCDDIASAAGGAAKKRNEQVQENLNSTIPNPEENRDELASCMDAVNSLGGAFSMEVQLPSMEEIIEKMCEQVDNYIEEKIESTMRKTESEIEGALGKNSPFQVSLTPGTISKPLTGQLK